MTWQPQYFWKAAFLGALNKSVNFDLPHSHFASIWLKPSFVTPLISKQISRTEFGMAAHRVCSTAIVGYIIVAFSGSAKLLVDVMWELWMAFYVTPFGCTKSFMYHTNGRHQSINQGPARKSLPLVSATTPWPISKTDAETAPVTPVRGPRTLELGSGKVAGKVLIVDHMWRYAKLLILMDSVTNWRCG